MPTCGPVAGARRSTWTVHRPDATARVAFDPQQMVAPNRQVAMIAVQFTGAAEQMNVRDAVTRAAGRHHARHCAAPA